MRLNNNEWAFVCVVVPVLLAIIAHLSPIHAGLSKKQRRTIQLGVPALAFALLTTLWRLMPLQQEQTTAETSPSAQSLAAAPVTPGKAASLGEVLREELVQQGSQVGDKLTPPSPTLHLFGAQCSTHTASLTLDLRGVYHRVQFQAAMSDATPEQAQVEIVVLADGSRQRRTVVSRASPAGFGLTVTNVQLLRLEVTSLSHFATCLEPEAHLHLLDGTVV